jgi:hypothetical protein
MNVVRFALLSSHSKMRVSFRKSMRYNYAVRRVYALVLLLVFSFVLIAPAFASASDPESKLPACCRRDGKHKCGMAGMGNAALNSSTGVRVSPVQARCPSYPTCTQAPAHTDVMFTEPVANVISLVWVDPDGVPQTVACYRMSYLRSSQKRGPPTSSTLL